MLALFLDPFYCTLTNISVFQTVRLINFLSLFCASALLVYLLGVESHRLFITASLGA